MVRAATLITTAQIRIALPIWSLTMWYIVSFDLPVDSSEDRKNYRLFQKALLAKGFAQFQKSLYFRWFDSKDAAKACRNQLLGKNTPPKGNVLLLPIPQNTFAKALHFLDGSKNNMPEVPNPWQIF